MQAIAKRNLGAFNVMGWGTLQKNVRRETLELVRVSSGTI